VARATWCEACCAEFKTGGLKGCLVPFLFQKILGFGSSFCIMKLNTMQIFWQKGGYSSFWTFGLKRPKNPKELQEALMTAINPEEFLAFYISSFQSSWHFAFAFY